MHLLWICPNQIILNRSPKSLQTPYTVQDSSNKKKTSDLVLYDLTLPILVYRFPFPLGFSCCTRDPQIRR